MKHQTLGFAVFAMSCLGAVAAEAPARKPNILLIVGDDMGYGDVGFHGCKDIPTPNLDALAAAGVRFTNGYVSGPYCSPTRAGLLTGRYQQRFGHEFNPGTGKDGLPLTETTLADRLKAAGYVTGIVGKWHLGNLPAMHPQQRGFDEFFGFLGGSHSYLTTGGILRGTQPVKEMDYTTDAFGREAQAFIAKHKTEPWFLYLAFNAVHTPMQATDGRLAKFPNIADPRRRTYDAMMLAMDEAIGGVRKKLLESGQEENTLVCFISDNGGPTMKGTTTNGSSNAPLRGSKRTTLEGGIRVPFIVSWKGKLKPGVFDQPAIQLDLTATALAAAGVTIQPEWQLDGVNLLPYLTGERAARHTTRFTGGSAGKWRSAWAITNSCATTKTPTRSRAVTNPPPRPNSTIWPRISAKPRIWPPRQPDKVKELQAKWDAWNATLVKPLWGGGKLDDDGAEPGQEGRNNHETPPPTC